MSENKETIYYETEDWLQLKYAIERMEDQDEDVVFYAGEVEAVRKAADFIKAQLDIHEGLMYGHSILTDSYYRKP